MRYDIIFVAQLRRAAAGNYGSGRIAALIPEVQWDLGMAPAAGGHATGGGSVGKDRDRTNGQRYTAVWEASDSALSPHVATNDPHGDPGVDPEYRQCDENMRYGDDILQACHAANLRSGSAYVSS